MESLSSHISTLVTTAFSEAGFAGDFGTTTPSERPDLSQFQCTGALKASKSFGKSPREIADAVAALLAQNTEVFSAVSVAGPGFLNLSLHDSYLAKYITKLNSSPELIEKTASPQTIVLDYGGPNVAKPLHVGHLRASIIGDSLRRLYTLLGHTVYGDIHLGDWGTPMGMLIAANAEKQPELPYFDETFTGEYPTESPVTEADLGILYPQAAAKFKEDEAFKAAAQKATQELQAGRRGYRALWQHFITVSSEFLEKNLTDLGVHFDWWYGESRYHNRITPLVEKLKAEGFAVESNGALIIPLEAAGNENLPPLILLKSDGAFLYSTTDIAAIDERVSENRANTIIYVVDQRQALHFTQVFAAARLTGLAPSSVELTHAGFGTMNGTDGKPFKTRAGGVMKLEDLITMAKEKAAERMAERELAKDFSPEEQADIAHKVGVAALKFADLSNNRQSNYIFDLDRFMSFEGKTGPYLVYTTVRLQSIFRKLSPDILDGANLLPATDIERNLMLVLGKLHDVFEVAAAGNYPHILAEHAFALAQECNSFYQRTNIVNEPDTAKQKDWALLAHYTHRQLVLLLNTLGIEVPERM